MKRFGLGARSLYVLILLAAPHLHAAAPEESLRRHLADIQKTTPGSIQERDLQKTVIELVRKMSAPPATPQAAHRHMVRGQTFLEEAKSQGSFERAAREFREITRLAPWLAEAHFNLAVVLEKAGQFDAALESLRMTLLADPGAKDAQALIYRIEARKEEAKAQAAEQRHQEQARLEAERERRQREEKQREQEKYASLAGIWCIKGKKCDWTMTVRENRFELKREAYWHNAGRQVGDHEIYGGEIHKDGRITGTYGKGSSLSGMCSGRALFYSAPMEGMLLGGERRIFFKYVFPVGTSTSSQTCTATRNPEYGDKNHEVHFSRP